MSAGVACERRRSPARLRSPFNRVDAASMPSTEFRPAALALLGRAAGLSADRDVPRARASAGASRAARALAVHRLSVLAHGRAFSACIVSTCAARGASSSFRSSSSILYCNDEVRDVRDDTSRTFAALEHAQHGRRHQPTRRRADAAPEAIAAYRARSRPSSRPPSASTTSRRPSPTTGVSAWPLAARSCWP